MKQLEAAKPSLTVLAGLVLLGGVLWVARTVLIPVAVAFLLTFVLTPLVLMLQRRGLSRTAAVLLVAVSVLVLVAGGVVAISAQLHDLAASIPAHKDNVINKIRDIRGAGPSVLDRLATMLEEITADLAPRTPQETITVPVTVVERKASEMQLVSSVARPLVSTVGSIGLVIALTVTMLLKREDLRNRLIRLAGQGQLPSTTRAIDEATHRMSGYLVMQLSLNAGFGLVFGLGLSLIGVPYAFLWGVLAAVLRFIPYIGTWLSAAPPLLVSIAVSEGWLQPFLLIGFILAMGIFTNNVLEPLLVSRTTGVSPVALVIAAAFWTWLWGPIGLILSTPITVCLSVLGRYVPTLSFLHVLLGTEPALDPQYGYYQRLLARDDIEAGEVVETYLADHTAVELADDILISALVRARDDHRLGRLDLNDLEFITAETRALVEENLGTPARLADEDSRESGKKPTRVVLGCPARDDIDVTGLEMLRTLLGGQEIIDIVDTRLMTAEVLEEVERVQPTAVLIAAVAPGGLARIRYLCKRLRKRFPEMQISVAYWGIAAEESKLITQLRGAGASHVAVSLQGTLQYLIPLLALAPHLHLPAGGATGEEQIKVELEVKSISVKP